MGKIPIKMIERLMKGHGAKRISRDAKLLIIKNIQEQLKTITLLSIRNAHHYGRKLITIDDVEYAFKNKR